MKTLSECLSEFLLASTADGLQPTSLRWYRSILSPMVEKLGADKSISDITTNDLRTYLVELRGRNAYEGATHRPEQSISLSIDTIASHTTAIHRFFKWCSDEYEMVNPMARIKRAKRNTQEPKAITHDDFIKLFESTGDDLAGARDRALLCLLVDTGARLGGITSLSIADVCSGSLMAFVTEKGNKKRWIYWTHYTQAVLNNYLARRKDDNPALWISMLDGQPMTTNGIYQVLKRLKIRAGVRGRSNPHAFRHNFARAYLEAGGDIVSLARLMGHSDTNTTASYYAVFSGTELQDMHSKKSPLVQWINLYKENQ